MNKLLKSIVLVLVLGMSAMAYAEVQNVKVSGEERLRANWNENLADLNSDGDDDAGWFENRAIVEVAADLTDNVLTVVEFTAEGAWGTSDNAPVLGGDKQDFDLGLTQGFVKLSEAFWTPLSVKLGRQYLNYGHGWLISDAERANNFDLVRATIDQHPWTIDAVYGKLIETGTSDDDFDLWGLNAGYGAETWNVEAYVFALIDESAVNNQPISLGLRGDVSPVEAWDAWGEFTYQLGEFGELDYSAWGLEAGTAYTFSWAWEPSISGRYIFASGDEGDGDFKAFNEMFEYDYYGFAFSPVRSNIHIINAQISVLPVDNVTLSADYYHYLQAETSISSVGDPQQDNGGISALTNGSDDNLGDEIDLVAEYDYTEDVSTQLYVALFFPGDAYSVDDTAVEIRGEILVNF